MATSDLYGSSDIENCRDQGHRLITAGSDKTPMKLNIICRTCSDRLKKSVYCAYGVEAGSFGQWRPRRIEVEETQEAEIE